MSFTQSLTNQTYTLNGALTNKSSLSPVLDLFSMGISSTKDEQIKLIQSAIEDDPILATKAILYLRDIRNGQGNRDILRSFFYVLSNEPKLSKTVKKIIKHLPEIGRWKDVIELLEFDHPQIKKWAMKTIIKAYKEQKNGLLFKWLPRQGKIAKQIIRKLNTSHGNYRRTLAKLSQTVEQQMCANKWSEINYSHVPSIANKKYAQAFLRHDSERRLQFALQALQGKTKINSSALYPHDIVRMIKKNGWYAKIKPNQTADALWKQLPNYMQNAKNVLPIIDTSGSMFSQAKGTSAQCIDIAAGLGIYFAEHNIGSYKKLWLNFSDEPKAYYLQGDTLSEKLASLDYSNWGYNTDINKVFDFILHAAKDNPEDTPEMILVVSDMEFDECVKPITNYEYIKSQFKALNVKMPILVFWRVNVLTKSQPVTKKDENTILVNGYSPSILKEILNLNIQNFDPYQAILEILKDKYTWLDE